MSLARTNSNQWVLTAAQLVAAAPSLSAGRPISLVDGWGGAPFRARSLFVLARKASVSMLGAGPVATAGAGDIVLEVEGISTGGSLYLRRFTVGPYQTAWIPTDGLLDVRVRVLRVATSGYDLAAIATDGDSPPRPPPLILGQSSIQPGTYYVPPGAYELVPATPDPGFSWSTTSDVGGTTTIPVATVVGQVQAVAGARFTVAVGGGFSCLWRIAQ